MTGQKDFLDFIKEFPSKGSSNAGKFELKGSSVSEMVNELALRFLPGGSDTKDKDVTRKAFAGTALIEEFLNNTDKKEEDITELKNKFRKISTYGKAVFSTTPTSERHFEEGIKSIIEKYNQTEKAI